LHRVVERQEQIVRRADKVAVRRTFLRASKPSRTT
jgi:hypothetical protein